MKKLSLTSYLAKIDLPLLVFLILFFNVKFVVKVVAIILFSLFYRDLKFGLSWKGSRLPLFYLFIIGLEIVKYPLLTADFNFKYLLIFLLGLLQWGVCLLAIHYIKLAIERSGTDKIHETLKAFYLLNFLVSMFFFALLLFHPSWLAFWGHGADISIHSPSAGDTILGITLDTSTVNATLNSFGLIYFLYKRNYVFSFMCLWIVVLCTSNVTFVFALLGLGLMVLTVRSWKLRLSAFLAGVLMVVLYFAISESNRTYIRNYFVQLYVLNKSPEYAAKPDTTSTVIDSNTKVAVEKPKSVTKLPDTAYKFDNARLKKAIEHLTEIPQQTSGDLKDSAAYVAYSAEDYRSRPGKLLSFLQTYLFLKRDVRHGLFGAGIGRFSSKLAFRASGVSILGTYPKKFAYVAPEFRYNHLKTFLFYYNAEASQHSVMNYPFSVYNQVLGEYGLIGVLLFVLFYLGFFLKRYKKISYGRYMIILLFCFFFMEYWFEMFSLIVLFELFLFLNISEQSKQQVKKIEST